MKYMLLLLITVFIPLLGSESKDAWINALQAIEKRDWPSAENFLDLVIQNMESIQDNSRSYVYVQRGEVYYKQKKYNQALDDLEKAFQSENLHGADITLAFLTKSLIYSDLGNHILAVENMNKCIESIPNKPEIEFSDEHVIIRNMFDNECYKNMIKTISIKANVCESEEDIQMLSSGVCLIKRKACDCQTKKPNEKNPEFKDVERKKSSPQLGSSNREECCYWCDNVANLGQSWCRKVFPTVSCLTSCLMAVDYIKHICYNCCADGNPYQLCIKPYEDIIFYMGESCTPL